MAAGSAATVRCTATRSDVTGSSWHAPAASEHPDHIERAVSLYASGLSCASIGKELQVNPEMVRHALLKAGVAMRKPGRPSATKES